VTQFPPFRDLSRDFLGDGDTYLKERVEVFPWFPFLTCDALPSFPSGSPLNYWPSLRRCILGFLASPDIPYLIHSYLCFSASDDFSEGPPSIHPYFPFLIHVLSPSWLFAISHIVPGELNPPLPLNCRRDFCLFFTPRRRPLHFAPICFFYLLGTDLQSDDFRALTPLLVTWTPPSAVFCASTH